jgi:hypothetical protein
VVEAIAAMATADVQSQEQQQKQSNGTQEGHHGATH